jgi:uncharacterized protein YcbK (DUF882 family)
MIQTGFLFKINPTDYRTGASPINWDVLNMDGDWRMSLPLEEKQHNFKFDTMSCTTFSALNVIETFINFLMYNDKLAISQLEFLNENGYIVNGKANFSDRFTAIMSGTTKEGNYFQNVMDSVRKDGLLPEKDLSFGGSTWEEYHDKTQITEAMKTKSKKILEIFDFAYEWVVLSNSQTELFEAFKQSPIQVAVTKESPQHAIMLPKIDWEFETYIPYLRPRKRSIAYAIKIQVKPKKTTTRKYKYFTEKEIVGLKPELVEKLDKARELAGIPFKITSGYRTAEHNSEVGGVDGSSHTKGEAVDIQALTSNQHFLITKALMDVGFTRISRKYPRHIHVDIAQDKPKNVLF